VVTKNTSVIEALRLYPAAREIFVRHGMACSGCMAAVNESIEHAARMHEVDLNALLEELNLLGK
jgi:hybrid cluster-associated redox disulfide protein